MVASGAIEIRDLVQICQGNEILKIPELSIPVGQTLCLQGSNGSGKTSLLRAIAGLASNLQGHIHILSRDMLTTSQSELQHFRADMIGFVFQHYRLVPYLSAFDNIMLPCHFSAHRKQHAIERSQSPAEDAFRLIRKLNLSDPSRLSKPAAAYSAGQQQRFAIARALIGQPSLVLVDEPASAMDAKGRRAVYQLILDECRATGATLICTTHDEQACSDFDRHLDMDELNLAQEHERRW
ncbi:ATP-binding cassette domain-containing protein [Endozoicomonadaceae bacterium StTr2]